MELYPALMLRTEPLFGVSAVPVSIRAKEMRDPIPLYRKAQRLWIAQKGFRDPYLAIIIAALEGRGVNLTAEDCRSLNMDSAVSTVAENHFVEVVPDE